jgi:hypothetical protein
MSVSRLILLLVVVGVGLWLWKGSVRSHFSAGDESGSRAPIDRAKDAAEKARVRNAESTGALGQAESGAPAAGVTENMTPDQVRTLLGPPSDTQSETLDTGVRRETWTYREVGKTVVFENGIVVSIR